jgi:hypothetical protein
MAPKEELLERAHLVRVPEANCNIGYPTGDEANFRLAIMKEVGWQFALRERRAQIEEPITVTAPRPGAPARNK